MNQENKILIEYIYNSLEIVLENETLTIYNSANEETKRINDTNLIADFKNIFINYKDKLFKFTELQKQSDEFSSSKMLIGGPVETISGMIDNTLINVNASFINQELNDMFKNIYLQVKSFNDKIAQMSNN